MRRLAGLLRRIADRLDPQEPAGPEIAYSMTLDHLAGPREISDPIDFDGLWRGHVVDGSFYVEENDVYGGGYL